MINVLELSMLHEYKFAWNISARICFHIYEHLDNSMFLYKYKLPYPPFIYHKFGFSTPSKINFSKLDGNSIFLFHLDTYQKDVEEIRNLIGFCLEKDIDLYIPMIEGHQKRLLGYSYEHIHKIRDILGEYETTNYDISNFTYRIQDEIPSVIEKSTKTIIRDIKMRKLLD